MHSRRSTWKSTLFWGAAVLAVVALVYSFRVPANSDPVKAAIDRNGALSFSAPGADGKTWRLGDHRGQVVLLNIFATWCPPCRQETPGLVNLSKKFAGKAVDVVGVSVDEGGPAVVEKFARQYDVPYPILYPSSDNPLTSAVQAIPVTLLIDKQGRVAKRYVGATEESTFAGDIEQVLKEHSPS